MVKLAEGLMPTVVYWGRDLGPDGEAIAAQIAFTSEPAVMNSSLDSPRRVSVFPGEEEGWSGTPGAAWRNEGLIATAPFEVMEATLIGSSALRIRLRDGCGVELKMNYSIDDHGVLSARATIANVSLDSDRVVEVAALRLLLPLPQRAEEIVDLTGRWTSERRPQRTAVTDGTHLRAVRRGRPGHDSPFLTMVGTKGFTFGEGEIWAAHVAWSGNQEYLVERLPEGVGVLASLFGGSELLLPGEVRLRAGESYESPDVLFTWSDCGIDGISYRLHSYVRDLHSYPSTPRPLVLNTWEAVYFDHDIDRLRALARAAEAVGVERFVLDDGWFKDRRDDTAGLGDWYVDEGLWPDGLNTLSDTVHAAGMQFGLWFEPEMVNLDSDVAREHSDWLLSPLGDNALPWRHQFVLNLSNPEAWSYLLDRIDTLVETLRIDFIKWDHNRDLHQAIDRVSGRPAVRAHTRAVYRLMDVLRARHPALEIESCASGGARIDLGMMSHAQRVWPSDSNDPIDRQDIQRWTGVLLPPEVIGTHIGPATAHTTHRTSSLSFRLITALFGHAGIEWDITGCSEQELEQLKAWASLYKRERPLLHSGRTWRSEVNDGSSLHGVVAPDQSRGLFAWVRTQTSAVAHTERVRVPGLCPLHDYSIRLHDEFDNAALHQVSGPEWMGAAGTDRGAVYSGTFLTDVGIPLPLLNPSQALLFSFSKIAAAPPETIEPAIGSASTSMKESHPA